MEKTETKSRMLFILLILLTTLMQASATALIKLGMNIMHENPRDAVFIVIFAVAMCLYCGALPLYTRALSNLKLAIVQPVVSGSMFLYTVIISILFFNETMTPLKALGIAAIIGGILIVAVEVKPRGEKSHD